MDRDEFIDLLTEELSEDPDNNRLNRILEAADEYAKNEKEQLSCEGTTKDAISRQAALDAVEKNACNTQRIMDAVNNLPSAQPEPKEGKWVYGEDSTADCVDGYRCSQCGFFVPWDYNHKFIDYINDYAYCPHCGTKMKGEQDGH